MSRFLQLLVALVAFFAGLGLLYVGYSRGVSLASKTSTGFAHLRTGIDGKTRVPVHHWQYAGGAALIIGSAWWMVKGVTKQVKRRR